MIRIAPPIRARGALDSGLARGLIVAAVIAVVAGLAAAWFFTSFEQVEERRFTGLRDAARANPLLAAERFIEAMGGRARQADSMRDLDALAPRSALVLPRRRDAIGAAQIERIVAWVEAGGLLVAEAEWPSEADPLFDAFGVGRERGEWKSNAPPFDADLPGSTAPLKMRPPTLGVLVPGADTRPAFTTGDPLGARIVGFTRGAGKAVLMSSFEPFMNRAIGRLDHAEALWRVLAWHDPAPQVLVYSNPMRLSIMRWVLDHAPYALVACVVLLALWLWRIALRFGPIRPDPLPARRRLTDHLRATGRLLWRRDAAGGAIEAARALAIERAATLAPDLRHLPANEQVAVLADLLAIAPADAKAIVAGGVGSAAELIDLTRRFQRIHARTRHPRTRTAGSTS